MVRFKPETTIEARHEVQTGLAAVRKHAFRSGAEHWRLAPTDSVEEALEILSADSAVLYAEPNYILTPDIVPLDPNFPEQWALRNLDPPFPFTNCTDGVDIDAPSAWDLTTGSSSVVVAVIDSGIALEQPDLELQIWANPLEVTGNSVDEDGCGYLNDVFGYDFRDNDTSPDDSTPLSHGTQVAGIIGAAANNEVGIAGVNWNVQLMPLRILAGEATISQAVQAIDYATCMEVDAINASWGGFGFSQTLKDAIEAAGAKEITFVAAAGNIGCNIDDPNCGPRYPASYTLDNIMTVAATDCDDVFGTSNWGPVSVDLAAPGKQIRTTGGFSPGPVFIGWTWPLFTSTSAAAPHVTGVVGLIRSLSPDIPVSLIKTHLLDPNSVQLLPDLDPNGGGHPVVSGGRLDAFRTMDDHDPNAPAAITDLRDTGRGVNSITLAWTATGDDGAAGTATLYQMRRSKSPISSSNWLSATGAVGEPIPASSGSPQSMTVSGLECNTTYYFGLRAFDEWGNGPLSNVDSATTRMPLCVASYCASETTRCQADDCGPGNCCSYGNCFYDPSCTGPDPCPLNACDC